MKIESDYPTSKPKVENSSILYNPSQSEKAGRKGGYASEISSAAVDNVAYKSQGKSGEDVRLEASLIDVTARRDYMTVMSNCMSEEDFAALEKDGFPVGSVDPETIVTVVDRIKAELVTAGVEISGYTDNLNKDTLEKITKDVGRAEEIAAKLKEYDLPDTQVNRKEIEKTVEKAKPLEELKDGTLKYMVENGMQPTIDNIYKAQFSSSPDIDRQGRGYFSEGTPGYYGKKAEEYNWEKLEPQIEKVIEETDKEYNPTTKEDAKWLIEKGIPLNKESLSLLEQLKQVKLPQEETEIIDTIVRAMANGQKGKDANLLEQPYFLQEAIIAKEAIDTIADEAINQVVSSGQKLTIQNLLQVQKDSASNQKQQNSDNSDRKSSDGQVKAKRQLEEVRLSHECRSQS